MDKRINFEDTLFLLNLRLRMLYDMLNLDADPDVFLTITLEDLEFIDAALTLLLNELLGNERLIERDDQLFNVEELEDDMEKLYDRVLNGDDAISAIPMFKEQIETMRERSKERLKRIAEVKPVSQFTDSTVVSSDELQELLKDF
jgi:hypothetical protein